METIGERLRRAIEDWGSIRKFQQAMEASAAPGTSGPAINRYLKDETEPAISFLNAAAEVLGVRPEWLMTGYGSPTTEPTAAEVAERVAPPWVDETHNVLFVRVFGRLMRHLKDRGTPNAYEVAQEMVHSMVHNPIEVCIPAALELPAEFTERDAHRAIAEVFPRGMAEYQNLMLHAIDLAIPVHREERLRSPDMATAAASAVAATSAGRVPKRGGKRQPSRSGKA
jgi:transcriptional regulator with XRE-family HTH domain